MPTKNTEKEIGTLYYKEDNEAEWKPLMKTNNILETPLVKTGDIVKRKGKFYEVIIAGWSEKLLAFIDLAEKGIDTQVKAIENYE